MVAAKEKPGNHQSHEDSSSEDHERLLNMSW